jgi:hypothetical protein
MSLFYDDNISKYLWYFYRLGRLDEAGLRAIIAAQDRYVKFVESGNPRDRLKTWESIQGVCGYLAQKGISNDR